MGQQLANLGGYPPILQTRLRPVVVDLAGMMLYNMEEQRTTYQHMEPIFLNIKDVIKVTSLSRSTIYRMMSDCEFPKQISIGARQVRWHRQEIIDWCDDKLCQSKW